MKKNFLKASVILIAILCVGCTTITNEEITQNETQIETTETTNNDTQVEITQTTRQITDTIGRVVEVPMTIDKVYCTEPVGAIYLYQVNPDKLLGWNYAPSDDEKVLLLEEYHDLDTFGMGSSTNYEAIIASSPEICIVTFETDNDSLRSSIEELETTLNIPVLALNSSLYEVANGYRFLGELLNEQEQGEALAVYSEEILGSIVEVPEEDQKTLYFGNGVDSLETAPIGSISAQEFELLHIKNVAYVETTQSNRVNISAEQILDWNPEIMIVNGEPSEDLTQSQAVLDIMNDSTYANVQAVQDGNVYGIPKSPFSFISRPMGPNRLVGIQWLKCIIYPEYYDFDLEETISEFYSLFYHVDLTNEQLETLLY